MPTHAENRDLPYSPRQLYDLVADVERYPEFLPWCRAARIIQRKDNEFTAQVVIGYKMVRESFVSRDVLSPPGSGPDGGPDGDGQNGDGSGRIDVTYEQGPFRYLNNHWIFEPKEINGQPGCRIDFFIDFEFRSALLQKVIGALFNEAALKMIDSFEKRAAELYGGASR